MQNENIFAMVISNFSHQREIILKNKNYLVFILTCITRSSSFFLRAQTITTGIVYKKGLKKT